MNGAIGWKKIRTSLLVGFLCCSFARAQEGPSSSQQDQKKPASVNTDTDTPRDSSAQDTPPADSEAKTPIPPARSAFPLANYDSFLRWGPLYVRSIEFFQSYDQISDVKGGAQGIFNQGSFNASVLRAHIVYDKMLGQNRLEAEYSPRLTVVNGRVGSDYLNQTLTVNWAQPLTPRWTLGLTNSVGYFSVRQLYGDYFLDVNTVTAASVPSSFLDGGGSWLNTNSQASFAYAVSPTSSFSVAPEFAYSHITGPINGSSAIDVYQYGSKFDYNKRLNAHRSIDANYFYQIVESSGNKVPYQSVYFGITQELTANTVVSGSVGFVTAGFTSSNRYNSFAASVQAARKVGRAVASVGYYRGMPLFSEVASQGLSQWVQGTFRIDLTRRTYVSVRGGYEDTLTSRISNVTGKFASSEVGYLLTPQISCFFSYAYKTQGGNDPLLLLGTRNFYLGGLRWTARPVQ